MYKLKSFAAAMTYLDNLINIVTYHEGHHIKIVVENDERAMIVCIDCDETIFDQEDIYTED